MYITDEHNQRLPFLRDKTSKLTTSPGVYIMKDKSGKIIYIGKAKNLHNRVTSYFRKGQDHLPKVWKMVSNVYDYEFIVTDSEFEALVLECSLIKLHTPKYNILLKDDKGYSYIRVTDEAYPRIQAVLQKTDDSSEYIGPYTSSFTVKQAVEEANRVFRLPTCSRVFPRDIKKQRPCLNYHIKRCMGVCSGQFSEKEYRDIIVQAVHYIKNGSSDSVERLTSEMERAAENLEFELAASLRDRINAIQKAAESQKVIDETVPDCDIIAISQNVDIACASVLMYRGGRLTDKADFFLGDRAEPSQMMEEFVLSYYSMKAEAPKNILLEEEPSDIEMLQQYLRERYDHAIYVSVPKRGHLLHLATMAKNNANEFISVRVGRTGREVAGLEELARLLGMEKPPRFIECYDISNLASSDMVAGMVVFENGRPCKKRYKKFAIKTVMEQNDYACMTEVIERRFGEYFKGHDEGFSQLPDLILLDGGNGHVNTIQPVLERLNIDVPLYGLVKDEKHRTRAIATGNGEISLFKSRAAFNLVTQIQDEVHRVAITYQKTKRKRSAFSLELTQVKGVGDKKAQKLITAFKTKEALKKASAEELRAVAGVNEEIAQALKKIIDEMS